MARNSNTRRWIVVGLVALGVVLAATLPKRGSDEVEEEETESSEASSTPEREAPSTASKYDPDGGKPSRRIAENCDAVSESLKYEEFIDRRALAILSWNNMPERSANLKIPVYVVGIEDGAMGVRVLEIPMREQYLVVWMGSGHMQKGPEDTFLLDPCSATIMAWPEMERGDATDDDEIDEEEFDEAVENLRKRLAP